MGHTSAFRLTCILGGLFATAMVTMAVVIYLITARQLIARSEGILNREAQRVAAYPSSRLAEEVTAEVARNAKGLDHFGLLTSDGRSRIAGDIGPFSDLRLDRPHDVPAQAGQAAMRILASRRVDGRITLIGRDISERRDLLKVVSEVIASTVLIILPGTLLIGALISRAPLARIRNLQRACRRIAEGELDVRMPVAGKGDELDQVAMTINDMVDDLGRVLSQVKSVTDAIAHDLRTPLARVKANLLDYHERLEGAGSADAMDRLTGDLDIVLERFSALLRIAELEASARTSRFAAIDLGRLVETAAGLHAAVAEDGGIMLSVQPSRPAMVTADPQLLLEALSNLIDNAIKFARSTVTLTTDVVDGEVWVSIADDGPGIPGEEREAVLRRFYRRDRDRDRPGTGLGLSVVTAIVHLHKFRLVLADAKPGLIATIIARAHSDIDG
ncbi:HAMP domain-containing sensor histidine kinase [Sphingomonas sp.]|uniref:sensor histidine kinase n=1 Tax=Sphingomonas sp. TaxID=28214 RepID=UPI000DB624A2|nr:HAMP domain-containing sensor histidine kinase [Sphingomonas sp.]PZU10114.1 MAG: histidine kinase [Sphingomonas sp.]